VKPTDAEVWRTFGCCTVNSKDTAAGSGTASPCYFKPVVSTVGMVVAFPRNYWLSLLSANLLTRATDYTMLIFIIVLITKMDCSTNRTLEFLLLLAYSSLHLYCLPNPFQSKAFKMLFQHLP
jgi:hypothetical protein